MVFAAPDGDALSVKNYDVTAQVKSSAGNGNTAGLTTGSLIVGSEESLTPARSFTAANYSYSASYMLDSGWAVDDYGQPAIRIRQYQ